MGFVGGLSATLRWCFRRWPRSIGIFMHLFSHSASIERFLLFPVSGMFTWVRWQETFVYRTECGLHCCHQRWQLLKTTNPRTFEPTTTATNNNRISNKSQQNQFLLNYTGQFHSVVYLLHTQPSIKRYPDDFSCLGHLESFVTGCDFHFCSDIKSGRIFRRWNLHWSSLHSKIGIKTNSVALKPSCNLL